MKSKLQKTVDTRKNRMMIEDVFSSEKRASYEEYLVNGNEVLISEDLLTFQSSKLDLTEYVNVTNTERAGGSHLYLKKSKKTLVAQRDLEKNPELYNRFDLIDIDYDISTYRGEVLFSSEFVEDALNTGINFVDTIVEQVKEVDINTKNKEIINNFKEAMTETVASKDELVSLVNNFSTDFDVKLYLSQSLYDVLDQENAIDYTLEYPRFKGKEVIKIDDIDIGDKGDQVGFVGDAYHFLILTDRKQVSIKYSKPGFYGEPLKIVSRFDTNVANSDAGYFINYTEPSGN